MVVIIRQRKMRFPGIGMKAQRSIYCRLGPGEPGRSVILTKKVKLAMDLAQEAPGKQKLRIALDSLLEQVRRLR